MAITKKTRPRRRKKGEMSTAERVWAESGLKQLPVSLLSGKAVLEQFYEAISFALPGGRYTPDFMVRLSDNALIFVEIKETSFAHGYRDSRSKLRAAASLHPYFTFVMAKYDRKNHKWDVEYIKPDGKEWLCAPSKGEVNEGSEESGEDQA